MHLLPNQYMLAKEAILREYVNTPDLTLAKDRVRTLVALGITFRNRLFSFDFGFHVAFSHQLRTIETGQGVYLPHASGLAQQP